MVPGWRETPKLLLHLNIASPIKIFTLILIHPKFLHPSTPKILTLTPEKHSTNHKHLFDYFIHNTSSHLWWWWSSIMFVYLIGRPISQNVPLFRKNLVFGVFCCAFIESSCWIFLRLGPELNPVCAALPTNCLLLVWLVRYNAEVLSKVVNAN